MTLAQQRVEVHRLIHESLLQRDGTVTLMRPRSVSVVSDHCVLTDGMGLIHHLLDHPEDRVYYLPAMGDVPAMAAVRLPNGLFLAAGVDHLPEGMRDSGRNVKSLIDAMERLREEWRRSRQTELPFRSRWDTPEEDREWRELYERHRDYLAAREVDE